MSIDTVITILSISLIVVSIFNAISAYIFYGVGYKNGRRDETLRRVNSKNFKNRTMS